MDDLLLDRPLRHWAGRLPGGAAWRVEFPEAGGRAVLLFSPGYGAGAEGPVRSATDDVTRERLLAAGYILAGLTYAGGGWGVEDGLRDQVRLAALLRERLPEIGRFIAWGHSMGGLVTAGLAERAAEAIDGAVVLCGSVAGPVAMLDQSLDVVFTVRCLVPGAERLPVAGTADEAERQAVAEQVVADAAATPDGRARLALAAAFGQLPTWSTPGTTRPAREAVEEQAAQQRAVLLWSAFAPRREIESRAGGNPSGNPDVDYTALLATSEHADLVRAMYARSSLDLDEDLRLLHDAARITADAPAVDYLRRNLTPTGRIQVPVLTVHCTGDAAPTVSQAAAYRAAVTAAGRDADLRQAFADRPGHDLSPDEAVAAIRTMDDRLETGEWPENTVAALTARAGSTAPEGTDVSFAEFEPAPFLRPDRGVAA